ncbi:MAG: hypothetical protein IJK96_03380 [Bacteroidales bacterium]|nr:hypothetical protein [Bacteroidales bacterium]
MKRIPIILALFSCSVAVCAQEVTFKKIFRQDYSCEKGYGIQGAASFGNKFFQFHEGNPAIVVYSLPDGRVLDEIVTDRVKTWHNNTADFSTKYFSTGDKYPLLYASQENINEHKALVYRILDKNGKLSLETVQTIVFPEPLHMGLYYPNIAVDPEGRYIYLTGFSRNSYGDPRFGNGVQILRFRLPSIEEGETVCLGTADIQERYCTEFKEATQGATVKDGKLYQVFGGPGDSCLVCTDLSSGAEVFKSQLNGIPGEPEGLGFYEGHLVVSCNEGDVFISEATF